MKILTVYFFITITAVQILGQSSSFITKFGDFSSAASFSINPAGYIFVADKNRSEERRVGKECRSRWSPYH